MTSDGMTNSNNEAQKRKDMAQLLCAKTPFLAVVREGFQGDGIRAGDVVQIESEVRDLNKVAVSVAGSKKPYMAKLEGLQLLTPETARLVRRVPVTSSGEQPRYLMPEDPRVAFDALVLPPLVKESFEELVFCVRNEGRLTELTERYGCLAPASRVLLLTGPSGTGKTSAAHAVADALGARLLSLGTVQTGSHFVSVSQRANSDALRFAHHAGAEAIVVHIDDGDDLISARYEASNQKHQDSLVTNLLQALDLNFRAFVVITTNASPEQIEPALRTRAQVVHFYEPTSAAREALCRQLVKVEILAPGTDFAAITDSGLSMREVARCCQSLVLRAAHRHLSLDEPQQISAGDILGVVEQFGGSPTRRRVGF